LKSNSIGNNCRYHPTQSDTEMATTPPTPNQPTKPTGTPPASGAKPVPAPGQKPANPAGQKPVAPGQKPPVAGQKPAAPQGQKPAPPPVKKPAPPKNRLTHVDATTRQLGQKLVDLGYLDEGQLESVYDEMRTSDSKMAEIAIERRMITDDQLLSATAELHGMKVDSLEDKKPTKDAIKVVPQNMAELYKMVPLDFEGDTLTVAMAVPPKKSRLPISFRNSKATRNSPNTTNANRASTSTT
jgi:type IV pilus assembly protein PilB